MTPCPSQPPTPEAVAEALAQVGRLVALRISGVRWEVEGSALVIAGIESTITLEPEPRYLPEIVASELLRADIAATLARDLARDERAGRHRHQGD